MHTIHLRSTVFCICEMEELLSQDISFKFYLILSHLLKIINEKQKKSQNNQTQKQAFKTIEQLLESSSKFPFFSSKISFL